MFVMTMLDVMTKVFIAPVLVRPGSKTAREGDNVLSGIPYLQEARTEPADPNYIKFHPSCLEMIDIAFRGNPLVLEGLLQ